MEIYHTKAALLAYLKEEELINAIKECETRSDVMGALWAQPEAYYNQLGDRWPEILSKTVSPDLLENYDVVINDNYYGRVLANALSQTENVPSRAQTSRMSR